LTRWAGGWPGRSDGDESRSRAILPERLDSAATIVHFIATALARGEVTGQQKLPQEHGVNILSGAEAWRGS
jgi:hypothetical protein